MGVGKTAFVRGFCSHLGIFTVKSPTYTVLNEYAGRKNVHHFDLYRISDGDDLYSVGFDDAVDSPGYCLAEWSENAEDYLREEPITVSISRTSFGDSATDTEALVRKIDITIPNLEII
jgi:tRNA threonylcarbamoyl adenosine modification protein YjeE